MGTPKPKNAIERRVEAVESTWNEFAESPDGRILRWMADPESAGIIGAFVDLQSEDVGDSPDMFVRFEEPFSDPARYGRALCDDWRMRYEQDRDGMVEAGIPVTWEVPETREGEPSSAALLRVCASFQRAYEELMELLVVFLDPREVDDPIAFEGWLTQLLDQRIPDRVRFMIVDDPASPRLDRLARLMPRVVVTRSLDLDLAGAYLELSRGLGKGGPGGGRGPDAAFRTDFVALTNAAARGDVAGAGRAAGRALAVAREQGWPQMEVIVGLALAAAHLGAGRIRDALAAYRAAGAAAEAAEARGDATGRKLVVQCRMAEAATLLKAESYAKAAATYAGVAPLARAALGAASELECWRMAALCHELGGAPHASWQCGGRALAVGEAMTPEDRAASTLSHAGMGLLRVAGARDDRTRADEVRRRVAQLLGPGWETGA